MDREFYNDLKNLRGSLYRNSKKRGQQADWSGFIKIQKKVYRIGAWKNTYNRFDLLASVFDEKYLTD